jgi:hypothetical protein
MFAANHPPKWWVSKKKIYDFKSQMRIYFFLAQLFPSPGVLRLGLGEFHNPFHLAPLGAAEVRNGLIP